MMRCALCNRATRKRGKPLCRVVEGPTTKRVVCVACIAVAASIVLNAVADLKECPLI